MKDSQKLHDWQNKNKPPEKKTEEIWVKPRSCMICQKPELKGAYGNWGDLGWTCSGECEKAQAVKPKYPGHEATTFEEKHHATLFGEYDRQAED